MQGIDALIPKPSYANFAHGPEFQFSVPLIPPSVNHYKMPRKQGGFFITKEAQAFIDAVCMIGRTAAPRLPIPGKFYAVTITVYVSRKKFLRGDSDNMEKLLFDALTKSGLITDDRYVTRHQHNRLPVELASQERTAYTISGREEP
jgi:Holliday junction resolvase RusA-like endonuclease